MSKPGINLDRQTVDEQLEQLLQPEAEGQANQDARFIQDLQYLYRKEEILARAGKRLGIVNQPTPGAISTSGPAETIWQEHNTLVSRPPRDRRPNGRSWPRIAAALAAVILLIGTIIGTTQFFNAHPQPAAGANNKSNHVKETATTANNVVFSDPLSQNINDWRTDDTHFFANGAYHLSNQSTNVSDAFSTQQFTQTALSYQLTMEEIKGDDSDSINSFGIILRGNVKTTNGNNTTGLYTFEITNTDQIGQSRYTFYKYDNTKQPLPWTIIWSAKTGQEFHKGQGPNAVNTIKVIADGSSFTFLVNGQSVGTTQDSSFQSGSMGMMVALKGTEVAFSNLLITQP